MRQIFSSIVCSFVLAFPAVVFGQTTDTPTAPAAESGFGATLRHLINLIVESTVKYSFQVLGGILVLVAGWVLSNIAMKVTGTFLDKHKIDLTIKKFIISSVRMVIMGLALVIALAKFGVEIAPFIAGLSVVGFGTSFALQGPLSNYAAGASLIFTKPFKVGEIIEVVGVEGEVIDMSLPRTEIATIDGTRVFIPNKHIIGEIIRNFSENKQLSVSVGVGYDADIDRAINIIKDVIKREANVTRADHVKVGIGEFGESMVMLHAKFYSKQAHYWDLRFDVNRKILEGFRKNNITIPIPQRDVFIHQPKA